MAVVVILAVVTAAATAVRSTWSPCGLSMLSTVTPLAEAGRGRRWSITALWFVAGAVLGGLTLGAAMAGLAALGGSLGISTTTVLAVATVAALVCAASDLDPFGVHIPFHGRQVNERWLDQYRAWVYGGGFGWQIGSGLATYITTAGVYLTILLAALTGRCCSRSGSESGSASSAAWRSTPAGTSPRPSASWRCTVDSMPFASRCDRGVIGVQLLVAVVAAGAWAGPVGALGASIAAGGLVLAAWLGLRRRGPPLG